MFYERFTRLCKRDNVTPAAVAKEIGLSNSATTYWKKGAVPKYDTLVKLANRFNVTVEYIRGDDMEKIKSFSTAEEFEAAWERITGKPHSSMKTNIDDRREVLLETFDKLDANDQQLLVDYGNLLSGQEKYKKESPQD